MHQQMMRYDEQAREMEMIAAAERQMSCSCSPFGTIISRAIKGRRNGREGRPRKEMLDYAMAYPPAQTYYVRPNARTITVTTNSNAPAAHTFPSEPTTRAYAAAAAPPRASGPAGNKPRKKKKKKRVAFAPESAGPPMSGSTHPPVQHAGHAPQHPAMAASSSSSGGAAAAPPSSVYNMQGAAEPYHSFPQAPPPGQCSRQGGHGYAYGYGNYGPCYYAPSPLTRWDVARTPRRHEYFSCEYRWYYPTPVRESIYSFATDRNHRLTSTFSEENPNACTIV